MPAYNRQLSLGQLKGKRSLSIFAFDSKVTQTLQDFWQGQLLTPPVENLTFMTTADYLLIKSTDVNDTLLGSGTRRVLVDHIDENFMRVVEVVETNGTTGTLTANKSLGVTVISAIENAVLGESNKGIITAEGNTTGDMQAVVAIGEGRNQDSHAFIPADEKAVMTRLTLTGEKNAEYKVVFQITPFVTTVPGSSSLTSIPFLFFESSIDIEFNVPPLFPSASQVNMRVLSDSGTNKKISGSYDMELSKIGVS